MSANEVEDELKQETYIFQQGSASEWEGLLVEKGNMCANKYRRAQGAHRDESPPPVNFSHFVTSAMMAVKPEICAADISFKCPGCHEPWEHNTKCKLSPYHFVNCLFIPSLDKVVYASTLFMLMCGHLVTFEESYMTMKQAIMHLRPKYTIMFTASDFISAVVKAFVMTYSVQVLIQGHDLLTIFQDLLNTSIDLFAGPQGSIWFKTLYTQWHRISFDHRVQIFVVPQSSPSLGQGSAHGMFEVWCYLSVIPIEMCARRSEVCSEPLCNQYEIQGDKFSSWIKYTIWAAETLTSSSKSYEIIGDRVNLVQPVHLFAGHPVSLLSPTRYILHIPLNLRLMHFILNRHITYETIGDRGFFLWHLSFWRTRCLTQQIQGPSLGTYSSVYYIVSNMRSSFTSTNSFNCPRIPMVFTTGFHTHGLVRGDSSSHNSCDADAPPPPWLQRVPGHPSTTFVSIWRLVPLFTALAYHKMDNYANHAAILCWTAAFEPRLFYWGLMLIPRGYYVDDDGHFVVY
ncbi:hypothetical protein BKA83DRAFT_4128575 [Pisolithus microcarpus]|nr:hypothetical protein BKA83DRAFT_4128575 [Pisolithus microcarpus]